MIPLWKNSVHLRTVIFVFSIDEVEGSATRPLGRRGQVPQELRETLREPLIETKVACGRKQLTLTSEW